MFGKNKKKANKKRELDGLILFAVSSEAVKAESILGMEKMKALLIPVSQEISPLCGVAVKCEYSESEQIEILLKQYSVKFNKVLFLPEVKQN